MRDARAEFVCDGSELRTGDEIVVSYPDGFSTRYAAIIRGDVAGCGVPGISQLVALAKLIHTDSGSYLERTAADLNGDGSVSVSDLVMMARDLKSPDPAGPLADPTAEIYSRGSSNLLRGNYRRWSRPVDSYLYGDDDGGLTRVERVDDRIVVEDYDRDFNLLCTRSAALELPLWGGFFAGEDYNYVIVGQPNEAESLDRETVRVVAYDKDWKRAGVASLRGANIAAPFDGGSLRCAEADGRLYIRTARKMFTSGDGANHQANLMLILDEDEMRLTDCSSVGINLYSAGYVSHSFNQFVIFDREGRLATLDHGDAYPRSAILRRYYEPKLHEEFTLEEFPGETGRNETGASLGGLAETSLGFVVAYNQCDEANDTDPRDVRLAFVSKDAEGLVQESWWRSKEEQVKRVQVTRGADATTPQLIPTGLKGGFLFWTEAGSEKEHEFRYAAYDASGNVGEALSAEAKISDCQPILWNGKVVWYATEEGRATEFFVMSKSGVRTVTKESAPER